MTPEGDAGNILSETGDEGLRLNAFNGDVGDNASLLQIRADIKTDFLDPTGPSQFTINSNGGYGNRGFANLRGSTGDFDGEIRNHDRSGTGNPKNQHNGASPKQIGRV